MQVLNAFVVAFAALWVCHGLHFRGTQVPDVWGCSTGFVCVKSRSPVPLCASFPKNVESFYIELVELSMHYAIVIK